ncbi:hypothetical protein KA977_07535 [Candidatus Dependentiae bacterium]|nr:hypothetical protein [Candidatus Dependentiae bacterium]
MLDAIIITSSSFSFKKNSYNTNFGSDKFGVKTDFPELYFDIILERDFWGAITSRFIPISVIFTILFFVIMNGTTNESIRGKRGFTVVTVLGVCASMLFITVSEQIQIRNLLKSSNIIYLEYFYFIIYLLILYIATNTILFVNNIQIKIIQYADNLIPKLLYWPIVTGIILIITVFVFY